MMDKFVRSLEEFKIVFDKRIAIYFDKKIDENDSSELKILQRNLKDYVVGGGKRLRPNIIYRMDEEFRRIGGIDDILLAFEFLHNSTLIDDDIIDEHGIRRNNQTLPTVYGRDYEALLSANMLRGEGYRLILDSDVPSDLKRDCVMAYNDIGRNIDAAQFLDLGYRGRMDLSEEDYIAQSDMVTARFIAHAFSLCAPKDHRSEFFEAGRNLGLAFQLSDDMMDVNIDKKKGRALGSDIREGTPTLLSIYASQRLDGKDKERFSGIFGDKDLKEEDISWVISKYGPAIDYTKQKVRGYIDKANMVFLDFGLPKDHWVFDFGEYSLKRLD